MRTNNLCFEQNYENSPKNSTENCHFYTLAVKNCSILHGHVFVMSTQAAHEVTVLCICKQQRHRSAAPLPQADQHLC